MVRIFFFVVIFAGSLEGQNDSSFIDFSAYVHLDSIMITAKREGFSVEEFIKIVQQDNTLESSFNNLRSVSYRYKNDISYYKKNGKIAATYESVNIQHFNGLCQWMEVVEEIQVGNYEKYYTSAFYDRVFYKPTSPCEKAVEPHKPKRSKRILEKRINELKKLIYTPGQRAAIPLIGKKTAIFSEDMIENYDFSIRSEGDSYIFLASINPTFNISNPNASIIKFLEVEMKKGSLQVLTRNYKLQYDAGVYNFDVLMLVDLERFDDRYIPAKISYNGHWKVVGKKAERCKFQFEILEFIEE